MEHTLLGIDACFECQNDAVSKILRVTNRQITVTLCACAGMLHIYTGEH